MIGSLPIVCDLQCDWYALLPGSLGANRADEDRKETKSYENTTANNFLLILSPPLDL